MARLFRVLEVITPQSKFVGACVALEMTLALVMSAGVLFNITLIMVYEKYAPYVLLTMVT